MRLMVAVASFSLAANAAGVAPKDLAWYDNVIAEKDGNPEAMGNLVFE